MVGKAERLTWHKAWTAVSSGFSISCTYPCEKPAEMLQQIISASSRPGDLVADFFMGSGSTVKAALALGRRAIGVELETGRFEQTVREVQDLIV